MSSVVYQEVSNNFTHKDQKIGDRDIVAVIYSPMTPTDSKVSPTRVGEMYIQISEGTTDKKTRAWISVASAGSTFKWEELMVVHDLPDTVAQTSKANHFEPWEQTIAGHQILSFVDGGDQTPAQSKLPADYDGQFYIAVKKLSDGSYDTAIWVAHGNQWLPIVKETVDTSKFAKLDTSNVFDSAIQLLGPAEHTRMISATRIKRDRAPIADASWKAMVEGEKTIYINDTVTPTEISIWTAVKVNTGDTNTGEWVMTWSSKGGGGTLPDDVAYTSKSNTFVPLQKMGVGDNTIFMSGARIGDINPQGVIVPVAFGEIYIRQIQNTNTYEFYIAAQESDTDAWIRLYDQNALTALDNRITALEDEDTAFDIQIRDINDNLDRMGVTIGQIDADMTTLESDLAITNQNVGILDGRVNLCETKIAQHTDQIAALETHIPTIESHGVDLAALNPDVAALKDKMTAEEAATADHETRITANTNDLAALKPDVATLKTKMTAEEAATASHNTRITALEGAPKTFVGLTDTPSTLNADTLLLVNADGTGITMTTITGAQLTQMRSNIASLISSDGSQSTMLNDLRNDLTAAQSQINTNTGNNTIQSGQIDTLQTDLYNMNLTVESLKPLVGRVSALETKMTAEEAATADHDTRIATNTSDIAALTARLDAINYWTLDFTA